MSKKFNIFLSALFCAFIGGVAAISLLLPDKDFLPWRTATPRSPPSCRRRAWAAESL